MKNSREYYEWRDGVQSKCFGLRAAQNTTSWTAMSLLLDEVKPKTIVELGSGVGGLTVMLQIWCLTNEAKLFAFDKDKPQYTDIFEKLGIYHEQRDILSNHEYIGEFLKNSGVVLLLCDNGDKPVEAATYGHYLKRGDYVGLHDYAATPEFFDSEMKSKYWNWHESEIGSVNAAEYEPVHEELMKYAAWGIFKKR